MLMLDGQSPCALMVNGQGPDSQMYAQPENRAGARPPQVAKATIAQIAAILGFMLTRYRKHERRD